MARAGERAIGLWQSCADMRYSRPDTVAVAMSGGVDSSVAAAMLLERGVPVIGLNLRLRRCDPSRSGCGAEGEQRARATAAALGIPLHVVDAASAFEAEVLKVAWDEYARGRTPSPCLLCNERLKFGLLLRRARELGATRLATGHYARVEHAAGRVDLLRASERARDQSYFLARLSQEQLMAAVFPLGALTKAEVRARATALALPAAEARDSQDACLVKDGETFAECLRELFGVRVPGGDMVDRSGRVLGRHDGIHRFTIGQRHRLPRAATHRRCWVVDIRPEPPQVVLSENESDLLSCHFSVRKAVWQPGVPEECQCHVQVRSRQDPAPCRLVRNGDEARVELDAPLRAVTAGQAAVFYERERVLGSGWIDRVVRG